MAIEVAAHITGTVWKIEKQVGESVTSGDILVILESMKMEMPIEATDVGLVLEWRCIEGQSVNEGDVLAIVG
jgi:acetyl-CoA carboxylase biotin carboxyl carrier protein